MKHLILLCIFCLVTLNIAYSQDDQNRNRYNSAEDYLFRENFRAAIPLYSGLLTTDPENIELNFKLGFCYLNTIHKKAKSMKYFRTAIENLHKTKTRNQMLLDAYYNLGKAYRINYEFQKAIATLNELKTILPDDQEEFLEKINREITMCENGIELLNNPIKTKVINLGKKINSRFSDHSPIISTDENMLIFTSRRKGSIGAEFDLDGQYYEDIYISYNKNGTWSRPRNLGSDVNTAMHEAACSLSPNGKQLFIYRGGNIYRSIYTNQQWNKPVKLGKPINSRFIETHATLSSDGQYIYFTSDRRGGFGGLDIYVSKRLADNSWAAPVNLGSKINTPFNEETPYIHPNGKILYFCSQGHKTIGGFDVFKSEFKNGAWQAPVNVGFPVSTTDNDVFFMPSIDGKRAYYSSQKAGTEGESDLYLIRFYDDKIKEFTALKGTITSTDGSIPKYMQITVIDEITSDTISRYVPDLQTGYYYVKLSIESGYNIVYQASNHEPHTENVSIIEVNAFDEIEKQITLQQLDEAALQSQSPITYFYDGDTTTIQTIEKDTTRANILTFYGDGSTDIDGENTDYIVASDNADVAALETNNMVNSDTLTTDSVVVEESAGIVFYGNEAETEMLKDTAEVIKEKSLLTDLKTDSSTIVKVEKKTFLLQIDSISSADAEIEALSDSIFYAKRNSLLENKHIRLRAIEPSDAEILYRYERNALSTLFRNYAAPVSQYAIERYIAQNATNDIFQNRRMHLMIVAKTDTAERIIGSMYISELDVVHQRAKLQLVVHHASDIKNKNADKALDVIKRYGFTSLNLHQFYSNIPADDMFLIQLLKNNGFVITGIKTDWIKTPTGWCDEYTMQLVNGKKK